MAKKSSAMGVSAQHKWAEAGLEIASSRFWKRGRTTVAIYMRLSEQSELPENHEQVIAKLARSQRLLAFGKDPEREDGRQYQLFRKDELSTLQENVHLAHQEIINTAGFLKQDAVIANAEALMRNICVQLDLALSDASVGRVQEAGRRFATIIKLFRNGGPVLKLVCPNNQPVFLGVLEDYNHIW